jgi:hypothetical protein
MQRLADISPEVVDALTAAGSSVAEFVQAALEGPDALHALADGLLEGTDLTLDQQEALGQLIESLFGTAAAAEAMSAAEAANADALGTTTEATQAAQQAFQQLVESATSNLPTLSDSISQVEDNLSTFGQTIDSATDASLVTDNFREMIEAFTDFTDNLEIIGDVSPRVRDALAEIGPEVAGGFAQALAEGRPAAIRELNRLIGDAEDAGVDIADVLGGAGTDSADAFAEGVEPLPGHVRRAAEDAIGAVRKGRGAARTAANQFGGGMTEGTRQGASGMAGAAGGAASAAIGSVAGRMIGAYNAGYGVGLALGHGIEAGIGATTAGIAAAAAKAVDQAEGAARAAADANSPSRLFAEIGRDMADGLALGLADATAVVAAAEALTFAAAGAVTVGAGSGGGSLSMGDTVINVDATGSTDPKGVASAVDTALANHRRKIDVLYRQRKG